MCIRRVAKHEHSSSEQREGPGQHGQTIAITDTRIAWCVWMRVLTFHADAITAAPTAVGFLRVCPVTGLSPTCLLRRVLCRRSADGIRALPSPACRSDAPRSRTALSPESPQATGLAGAHNPPAALPFGPLWRGAGASRSC